MSLGMRDVFSVIAIVLLLGASSRAQCEKVISTTYDGWKRLPDGSVKGVIAGALPGGIAVAADGAVYAGKTATGRSLKKLVPAPR